MTDIAIAKIKQELAAVKGSDRKVDAVKTHVADALTGFCQQDAEFAQAIVQTDKTLEDCCKSVMSGCGQSISDFEVYHKAVQFYFPGANICATMTIDLCASVSGSSEPTLKYASASKPASSEKPNKIFLDLADFL